jgi:hypothetical protein
LCVACLRVACLRVACLRRLADTFPDTVSSIEVADRTFPIAINAAAAVGRPRRVVDFPGHARLRTLLPDMVAAAKAVIFVVDGT